MSKPPQPQHEDSSVIVFDNIFGLTVENGALVIQSTPQSDSAPITFTVESPQERE